MAPYNFDTTADVIVKDLTDRIHGRTILITGVSPNSLGAQFVTEIVGARPKLIIVTARTPSKAEEVVKSEVVEASGVPIKILPVDFASQDSVRKAAAELNAWEDVPLIDVLINNAGIMGVDYAQSPDRIELHLATNHLGPWLFTNMIMSKIVAAKEPRVVWEGENYNRWAGYGQSKTANMLSVVWLAKQGPKGLTSVSIDPGVIHTNLGNHLSMEKWGEIVALDRTLGNDYGWVDLANFPLKTPSQGVSTHVYAAFAPEVKGLNGRYFIHNRLGDPRKENVKPWATDLVEAEMMWELSEKLTGQTFNYPASE